MTLSAAETDSESPLQCHYLRKLGGKTHSPWIGQYFALTGIDTNSMYEFALPACSTLARSTTCGHRMSDLLTWSPTKHFLPSFWKRDHGNEHMTGIKLGLKLFPCLPSPALFCFLYIFASFSWKHFLNKLLAHKSLTTQDSSLVEYTLFVNRHHLDTVFVFVLFYFFILISVSSPA